MNLSIIIVNYNTKELTKQCIESIIKTAVDFSYEIILIDNASNDGSLPMLQNEFPQIKFIRNRKNIGFAKANNQGIKVSHGDFILLLNSDTIVLEGCLRKTLDFFCDYPKAEIVGCQVLNNDGSMQYSCSHFPNILTEIILFTKNILKYFWDPVTYYRYMHYLKPDKIRSVDAVSGCFLCAKRETFNKIGLLDEHFFMYYEDTEFCLRAKKNGIYTFYFPEAKIIHLHGKSNDKLSYATLQHCYKSAQYYFCKTIGAKSGLLFKNLCVFLWGLELFFLRKFKGNKQIDCKMEMITTLIKI